MHRETCQTHGMVLWYGCSNIIRVASPSGTWIFNGKKSSANFRYYLRCLENGCQFATKEFSLFLFLGRDVVSLCSYWIEHVFCIVFAIWFFSWVVGFKYFSMFTHILGRWTHFLTHICLKGLVQPPTSFQFFLEFPKVISKEKMFSPSHIFQNTTRYHLTGVWV